jgi:cysteine desulfurase
MKRIYLDHAATTPVDEEVVEAMLPYFTSLYGNASSLHSFGTEAHDALEQSRQLVAEALNADAEEIIFTGGGTESDNIAIKGIAYQNKDKKNSQGPHIITSAIEHPAVLETCKHLEKEGFNVKYLPVDKYGIVNIDELKKTITKDTFLITIMFANNEIGTIQPIEEIAQITKENNIIFHTDAVQAIGKLDIDLKKLDIDLLSISAHKIYGPKGVGALFIRNGLKIQPIVHGGGHEKGLRSSTENIPGIVGLGKACELARKRMKKDIKHIKILRDKLINNVLEIEESFLNGHPEKRLVNNAHFYFTGIEGESLVLGLNDQGVAASTGSACSSKKLEPSHVLLAIGLTPEQAHGSLRITLGRENTEEDIAYASNVLHSVVEKLRLISPLWRG